MCPAGWKPGGKTMVADAEKSLEYFESVGDQEVGHCFCADGFFARLCWGGMP